MTLEHDFTWKIYSRARVICVWTKKTVEFIESFFGKCKEFDTVEVISSFKCSLKSRIKKNFSHCERMFYLLINFRYKKRDISMSRSIVVKWTLPFFFLSPSPFSLSCRAKCRIYEWKIYNVASFFMGLLILLGYNSSFFFPTFARFAHGTRPKV